VACGKQSTEDTSYEEQMNQEPNDDGGGGWRYESVHPEANMHWSILWRDTSGEPQQM
jgi:hypothetical protein